MRAGGVFCAFKGHAAKPELREMQAISQHPQD